MPGGGIAGGGGASPGTVAPPPHWRRQRVALTREGLRRSPAADCNAGRGGNRTLAVRQGCRERSVGTDRRQAVPGTTPDPRGTPRRFAVDRSTALESLPAANAPSAWMLAATTACATSTLPNMREAAAASGSRSGGGAAVARSGRRGREDPHRPVGADATTPAKNSRCMRRQQTFSASHVQKAADDRAVAR